MSLRDTILACAGPWTEVHGYRPSSLRDGRGRVGSWFGDAFSGCWLSKDVSLLGHDVVDVKEFPILVLEYDPLMMFPLSLDISDRVGDLSLPDGGRAIAILPCETGQARPSPWTTTSRTRL